MNVVAKFHLNVSVILELPGSGQARAEPLVALRTVVEEYQGLVGILQDDVVGSVLLFLKIQIVDVSVRTDNQRLLVTGSVAPPSEDPPELLDPPPHPAREAASIATLSNNASLFFMMFSSIFFLLCRIDRRHFLQTYIQYRQKQAKK